MKKRMIIGIICVIVVLCLILGVSHLSKGTPSGGKDDEGISSELENDTKADDQSDADNGETDAGTESDSDGDTISNSEDKQKNTSDSQSDVSIDGTVETPVDIFEDDENDIGGQDETGTDKTEEISENQSETDVPDNSNELPVDWID